MVNSNSNTNDNTFVAPMGGVDIDNMTDEQVAEVLNGMTYNELIESYVEGLIYEKGMANLDADLKAEIKEDLIQRLDTDLNLALVDALTDEQAAELNKQIDSGKDSPEDVRDFLTAAGVDISEVTSKTLQEFHAKYADEVINAEEE